MRFRKKGWFGRTRIVSDDGFEVSVRGEGRDVIVVHYDELGRRAEIRATCELPLKWRQPYSVFLPNPKAGPTVVRAWLPPHDGEPCTPADAERIIRNSALALEFWGYDVGFEHHPAVRS